MTARADGFLHFCSILLHRAAETATTSSLRRRLIPRSVEV